MRASCQHFWSVRKLLRIVLASQSDPDPASTLAEFGIKYHAAGGVEQRKAASRSATAAIRHTSTQAGVTYSSRRVWITGFLHFGDNLETCDNLELCDSNFKLLTFLVDPSPQVVDQLVLIKRWVLVDKAINSVRTTGSLFLEVHDQSLTLLLPVSNNFQNWAQEDALSLLESNYLTKDPPMFTGTERWTKIAALSQSCEPNNDAESARISEGRIMPVTNKTQKRKRIHAVFGRVTSVSAISRQKDRASSHFFAEIESFSGTSVTNVMFTGVEHMRWKLFLRLGKIVLLTDLVKVRSRECEMVLLQTSHQNPSKPGTEGLNTLVLIWDEVSSAETDVLQCIYGSVSMYSNTFAFNCMGKLLNFKGQVCRLLWDECVELIGLNRIRVIVCLFHFPYTNELVRLREGATVQIHGAHVLLWPTPVNDKLVVGLCPRSQFTIFGNDNPSGNCIAVETRSQRGKSHKWSNLGDFHRQSMVLSMWLLEILERLSLKFFFKGDELMLIQSSHLLCTQIGRRKATSILAKKLGVTVANRHDQIVSTLGARFLKCHSSSVSYCSAINLPLKEKLLTCTRLVTIRDLQIYGEKRLQLTNKSGPDLVKVSLIRIPANDLHWCLLLGGIRGNIDIGDLEVFDRTGSIALRLNGGNSGVSLCNEHGMYLFRKFEFEIEKSSQSQEVQLEENVPMIYSLACSADNVEIVRLHDDETISGPLEGIKMAVSENIEEVIIMVTRLDAVPHSSIRSIGILNQYRFLHGIIYPVGNACSTDQFLKSVYTADILVNTQIHDWFIQKGGYYRMKVIKNNNDTATRSCEISTEEHVIKASIDHWAKSMIDKDIKPPSLKNFNELYCHRDEIVRSKCRKFQIYRMETGVINSIIPIKLEGVRAKSEVTNAVEDKAMAANATQLVRQMPVQVTNAESAAINILESFLQHLEKVYQVYDLLHYPFIDHSQHSADKSQNYQKRRLFKPEVLNLHKSQLMSVVGIVTKRQFFWRISGQKQSFIQPPTIGVKHSRELLISNTGNSSRQLVCILHIRDLRCLDTIEIRIDASRFGLLGTLEVNSVVEFSRLKGFVARITFKLFLNWCHLTAAKTKVSVVVPHDAELYGELPTTFLSDLYSASCIDRLLHRFVVGVVHVSYVVLKRKCRLCYQPLEFVKRRGVWRHFEGQALSKYSRCCACIGYQWNSSNSNFKRQTFMGMAVRCVVDDGSGQAELFLENDVAWELLTCSAGQQKRFEDILSNYVEELSYYSGRTANESFASSKAAREQEYYQNELQAFVINAIPSLRSIVVFAHQFYKANVQETTSVLKFGKDIHLTTKTLPQLKLEAKRVDRLHVRSELQRRLAQLRQRM